MTVPPPYYIDDEGYACIDYSGKKLRVAHVRTRGGLVTADAVKMLRHPPPPMFVRPEVLRSLARPLSLQADPPSM